MSLKSMHAKDKQSKEQESSLELIEQQSRRIAELEQMTQTLLSEKQKLVLTMQEQKDMIAEQAEQIVKLNGSDLILKENDRLEQENEKLQQEKQAIEKKAQEEVQNCKAEYERKKNDIALDVLIAKAARRSAEAFRNEQKRLIQEKVQEGVVKREKWQNRAYYGVFLAVFLYACLTTIFAACRSDRFLSDFVAFFSEIGKILWGVILMWSNLGEKILYSLPDTTPFAIRMMMGCIPIVLLGVIVISILAFGVWSAIRISKNYPVKLTVGVCFVSAAAMIYFGDLQPENILAVWLIIQMLYLIGLEVCFVLQEKTVDYLICKPEKTEE